MMNAYPHSSAIIDLIERAKLPRLRRLPWVHRRRV
jgi:hypothetical protein